ncbi:MAG TPA: hypothetical protein PKB02_06570 [Anaerohalosphaeraceae bacterium]|nr:hypothetical protein [Anaerohalosphaeraceae bacterium]
MALQEAGEKQRHDLKKGMQPVEFVCNLSYNNVSVDELKGIKWKYDMYY